MTEAFLQYLWRLKLPGAKALRTTDGRPLHVVHCGEWNQDEGPDFLNARLRIGNMEWAGNVEIHVRSSQWQQHGHEQHPAYRNVILHVVFEDDMPEASSLPVATLELSAQIPEHYFQRYQQLQQSASWIPCAFGLPALPQHLRTSWLQRMLVERLEQRTMPIEHSLAENHNDWQETFYQMLTAALGAPANSEPMRLLARLVPLKILSPHRDNLQQVEAMLFGTASLLPARSSDDYVQTLNREFRLLKRKYGLQPMQAAAWRFFRLRPAAFPTLRIAQLAELLQHPSLLSQILEAKSLQQLVQLLQARATGYWHNHYRFGITAPPAEKPLGNFSVRLLLINCVVPFLFCYGKHHGNPMLCHRALQFLEQLPPENHHIIRGWKLLGIHADNAADTQALLHLKRNYCDQRQCLHCAWGSFLIQGT